MLNGKSRVGAGSRKGIQLGGAPRAHRQHAPGGGDDLATRKPGPNDVAGSGRAKTCQGQTHLERTKEKLIWTKKKPRLTGRMTPHGNAVEATLSRGKPS